MKTPVESGLAGAASAALAVISRAAGLAIPRARPPRLIARFSVLAIGVAALFATPALAGSTGLAGSWDTEWGQAEIRAADAGYRGHYVPLQGASGDEGDITLSPYGNTLTGYWAEPDSAQRCATERMGTYYWGRLLLDQQVMSDGFSARWGYCANGPLDNNWQFSRKTAAPATGNSTDTASAPAGLTFLQAPPTSGGRSILHPGDTINVSFAAPAGQDRYSWVGFVLDDALADPTPEHYVQQSIDNRTTGTMTFEVPAMLGNYRLWMYDGRNRKVLKQVPVRIEVDTASAALDLPGGTRLEPGQEFDVNFRASPNYRAYVWVKIVGPDTPRDIAEADLAAIESLSHMRLNGKTNGTLTFSAPQKPGRYLLRMQDPDYAKTLTQVEIQVVAPSAPEAPAAPGAAQPVHISAPTIQPTRNSFAPGSAVQVQFSGLPAIGQDWVAISRRGDGPKKYYDLIILTGKPTEGTLSFKPLPAGDYEVRLYTNWPDGGYDIVARAAVRVGKQPAPPLPAAPLALPAPAPVAPSQPTTPTAGTTATATDPMDAPIWGPQTDPLQPYGTSQSAAAQRVIDQMSAQRRNTPQSPVSGGPVLDTALARYNHLYVTIGGEHWFDEETTQYALPDEKNATDNAAIDSETTGKAAYTGYFDFSTNLAASYFSVSPKSDGAGVNTGQDNGFGCSLQTGGLTWDGTIFSYSLNEEKEEDSYRSDEFTRKVYCGINIVGVVAADGSALNSLQVSFRSSLSYLPRKIQDYRGVADAYNTGISYTLQNLPIDIKATYDGEPPEYRNVGYLEYHDCMVFFGAADSASSYVAYLGAYEPAWSKDADAPFVLSSEFARYYDHTRWSGDITRVAGRYKGDSIQPGISVELCRR